MKIRLSLLEYMNCFPKKEADKFEAIRECTSCKIKDHHQNFAFIMATKMREGRHFSINLCRECVKKEKWKTLWKEYCCKEDFREWQFYMWRLDSPVPHKDKDRVNPFLDSDFNLFLEVDFNPSRREHFVVLDD